jgi:hypothetical protein
MPPDLPEQQGGQTQIDRFKELARELGCDEDGAAFEVALKKIVDAKAPPKHEPKKRPP